MQDKNALIQDNKRMKEMIDNINEDLKRANQLNQSLQSNIKDQSPQLKALFDDNRAMK